MKTVLSMLVAVGTLAATEVWAQAPSSVGQSDREFRPPSQAGKASRAARAQDRTQAQRQDRRDPRDARAQQRAVAPAAFDGSWSVAIMTQSGACEPRYLSRWRSSTAMSYRRQSAGRGLTLTAGLGECLVGRSAGRRSGPSIARSGPRSGTVMVPLARAPVPGRPNAAISTR
jgi:hypothetical protein